MLVKLLEKNEELISISDLIDQLKNSPQINECGAIFSFEGIVRGQEEDQRVEKLILSTPDKSKTLRELENIVDAVKHKYEVAEIGLVHYLGEFYSGESLFLVAVLGRHRQETLDALTDLIERTKFELDFKKEEISTEGTNIIMSGG